MLRPTRPEACMVRFVCFIAPQSLAFTNER